MSHLSRNRYAMALESVQGIAGGGAYTNLQNWVSERSERRAEGRNTAFAGAHQYVDGCDIAPGECVPTKRLKRWADRKRRPPAPEESEEV